MVQHIRSPFRIFKRGAVWHAYIATRINGRRVVVRESTGCSESDAATEWCLKRLQALTTAPDVTNEITLDAAAGRWVLEVVQYQSSKDSTLYRIDRLLKEMDKNIPLSEITKNDINRFIGSCRAKGRGPASINRYLSIISALFTRARDYWDCKVPSYKMRQFKQKEPVENIKFFTVEEVEKIVENAADHIKPIIWTALYTGMRRGRLFGLKWEQIDFENRIIVFIAKRNDRNQSVPIVEPLRRILESLPRDSEYVFTGVRGGKINCIKESWRAALEKAKIPYRCFHTMRHTFATLLLQSTRDLRLVKEACGHSSIDMTMRYAHLVNGRVAEGLNNLFNKKPDT